MNLQASQVCGPATCALRLGQLLQAHVHQAGVLNPNLKVLNLNREPTMPYSI